MACRKLAVQVLALVAAACCREPEWQGVIETTPIERPALQACGPGALTADGGKRILRRPYLQRVGAHRAVVVWAAWPRDGRVVQVRTAEGELVGEAPARYAGDRPRKRAIGDLPDAPIETVAPEDFYLERADLAGLRPGHLYCYRVVDPDGVLVEWAPLQTAPTPASDATVELVVIGDSGTGNAAQRAIAQRLEELPFELMIFLGDIAYKSGTPLQIEERFFDVYRPLLSYVPAWPVPGNHEYRTRDAEPYLDAFVLPNNERWYSFDWGDIHFVALDTNRIGPEQARWLEQDLAASDRQWTIVYAHHPPYTSARRGPSRRFRGYFQPILERYDVDLVLAGHEHQYERFRPIGGITYIVSGGGGGRITRARPGRSTVIHRSIHHLLALRVTPEALHLRAIDIEGEVFDEIMLTPDESRTAAVGPAAP